MSSSRRRVTPLGASTREQAQVEAAATFSTSDKDPATQTTFSAQDVIDAATFSTSDINSASAVNYTQDEVDEAALENGNVAFGQVDPDSGSNYTLAQVEEAAGFSRGAVPVRGFQVWPPTLVGCTRQIL